jgi:hypothetical protein
MTPARTAALLSALSRELADMILSVEGLEALVMAHARLAAPADRADVLTRAQDVDSLGQRLHALHRLTASLAAGRPVEAALDAIPLADLAGQLRGAIRGRGAEDASPRAAAGDLSLFD